MNAQSAEGTVAAEQSASSQTQEQPKEKQQELVSISDALIKAAKESGHDVGELKESETPQESPVEKPTEAQVAAETEEQPELLAEAETTPDQQEEKPKAEDKLDKQVPLSEVIAERRKKQEALERAQNLETENQQLKAYVAQVSGPRPTQAHPFADVYDGKTLENYAREYREMRTTARMHRDGTDDEEIVIYKDKNGKEIKGVLTKESAAELEDKADNMLQSAIPKHVEFLRARQVADNEALKAYPEFEKDPRFYERAVQVITAYPDLATIIGPNLLQVVARYLKGEDLENSSSGNGAAAPQNEVTRKIVQSAQQKVAPTPTKNTTAFSERTSGADLASANKKLAETGSMEDANAVLRIQLGGLFGGTTKKIARSGE